jgi:hypothetical protein
MPFVSKFLWIVNMNTEAIETSFAKHALAIGATGVCIRTSSTRFPGAIGRFKALNMKVYAWKWPGVIPGQSAKHYYALDEADYVAKRLIPIGLDGYIVDPESDGHVDKRTGKKLSNDWDQAELAPVARQFCALIRQGANGKPFVFGTTSGCAYPGPKGKRNLPGPSSSAPAIFSCHKPIGAGPIRKRGNAAKRSTAAARTKRSRRACRPGRANHRASRSRRWRGRSMSSPPMRSRRMAPLSARCR